MAIIIAAVFWVVLAQAEAGGQAGGEAGAAGGGAGAAAGGAGEAGGGAAGGGGNAGAAGNAGNGAPANGGNQQPSIFDNWFWLAMPVVILLFYFIVMRPRNKERQDQQSLLDNLKKNDRIQTIGGIIGTVVNAPAGSKQITVRLEDDGARMRILRNAVSKVLTDADIDDDDGEKKADLK